MTVLGKVSGRTALTLGLFAVATPAQASDFSGMIYYIAGAFFIGLAVVCAIAWGITYFVEDRSIKWIVRSLAIGGYLLFAYLALFGLGF